jgi:hypothetical protein
MRSLEYGTAHAIVWRIHALVEIMDFHDERSVSTRSLPERQSGLGRVGNGRESVSRAARRQGK